MKVILKEEYVTGNMVTGALCTFMGNQSLSSKARLAVRRGVLVPTLIYGSES